MGNLELVRQMAFSHKSAYLLVLVILARMGSAPIASDFSCGSCCGSCTQVSPEPSHSCCSERAQRNDCSCETSHQPPVVPAEFSHSSSEELKLPSLSFSMPETTLAPSRIGDYGLQLFASANPDSLQAILCCWLI